MRRLAAAVAALWAAAIVLWLLSVTGHGAPETVSQGVAALALLATLGAGGAWLARSIRRFRASGDPAPLLAPALLLVALAVRLVGLDHEVGEGFYL
ncbi:MAG TPA: hypothetical protein VLF66_12620, partial [Thermoanaerobaculia bacterium]|nr:hypothetical protein [Thermoanaerobaculia bacterium]